MAYDRDPIAELWDKGAAALLRRAYARPGQWVGTALAPPPRQARAYFTSLGIDLGGPDTYISRGRAFPISRWERGFTRSLWHLHRWYYHGKDNGLILGERRMSACRNPVLLVEFGRTSTAGRAVRLRVVRGGQAALKAAEALPASARYTTGKPGQIGSRPGAVWRDPSERDWIAG